MSTYLADDVSAWLFELARDAEVLVPQPRGTRSFAFVRLPNDDTGVSLWPYAPTVLPPVKALLPADDVLLDFSRDDDGALSIAAREDAGARVLVGVRGCDVRGIALMDRVLSDGGADPFYFARRSNTSIIAATCLEPCGDRAFCQSVGSLDYRDGADVELTRLPDGRVLIRELSERGKELIARADFEPCADGDALRASALETRPESFGRQLPVDLSHDALEQNLAAGHELWARHTERCFSCGTCNHVCPTCYCFDVRDELELDARSGSRRRDWDACMNPAFAEVAGGHNFRPAPAARQRHRVHRKFKYLNERFEQGPFCVGCGRCGSQCTTGIDIFDIVSDAAVAEVSS